MKRPTPPHTCKHDARSTAAHPRTCKSTLSSATAQPFGVEPPICVTNHMTVEGCLRMASLARSHSSDHTHSTLNTSARIRKSIRASPPPPSEVFWRIMADRRLVRKSSGGFSFVGSSRGVATAISWQTLLPCNTEARTFVAPQTYVCGCVWVGGCVCVGGWVGGGVGVRCAPDIYTHTLHKERER